MDENKGKSMYEASSGEIARKNFVAGFFRSLGGFVVTLFSWGVIYLLIVKLILPQLAGTIAQMSDLVKLLPKTSTTTTSTTQGTTLQIPENLLQQLQQK